MTINTRIEGILRLKTPLHHASTDKSTEANMTLTMKQPICTPSGMIDVPYVQANSIGGRLRREGARVLRNSLVARGHKLSRELYSGLNSGSSGAAPDNGATVEEVTRGSNHVFQGLFGGGARMLEKKMRPSDLYPVISVTIDAGQVPARYGNGTGEGWIPANVRYGSDLMHKPTMFKVDDVMLVKNANELVEAIDGGGATIATYQSNVLESRVERAASKAAAEEAKKDGVYLDVAKRRDVSMLFVVEAIAAGTQMYFRVDLKDDATDAQVGLLAQSVAALVNRQDLGGMVRNGYGRFAADLSLVRNGERTPLLNLLDDGETYELAGTAAALQAAAAAEIEATTLEEMVAFYTPREKAESGSAAKAAKGSGKKTAKVSEDE